MYFLKEAFRHYQRFCKRSPQMVPSLEFSLHHADDPLYNEGEYPLATGEKGKELLSYVPIMQIIRWCRTQ